MAEENIIKMKKDPTVWENIFANDTPDKGLISNIDKELIWPNTGKTNNPIKKWAMVFWCGVVWDLYTFWIWNPYQMYHEQICSLVQYVFFSFCWWFSLLCTKFLVDAVPFVYYCFSFPCLRKYIRKILLRKC